MVLQQDSMGYLCNVLDNGGGGGGYSKTTWVTCVTCWTMGGGGGGCYSKTTWVTCVTCWTMGGGMVLQ